MGNIIVLFEVTIKEGKILSMTVQENEKSVEEWRDSNNYFKIVQDVNKNDIYNTL